MELFNLSLDFTYYKTFIFWFLQNLFSYSKLYFLTANWYSLDLFLYSIENDLFVLLFLYRLSFSFNNFLIWDGCFLLLLFLEEI